MEEREEEICSLQEKVVEHVQEQERLEQEAMFFQAQLETAEGRIRELEQLGVPGEEFERLESELKKWKREAREKIKS